MFSQTVLTRKLVKIVPQPISLRVLALVKVCVKAIWTKVVSIILFIRRTSVIVSHA